MYESCPAWQALLALTVVVVQSCWSW